MRLASILIPVALAVLVIPMYGQRTGLPVAAEEVIARMEESNRARQTALQSYHSLRRYEAANLMFHRQASVLVDMQYAAPGEKNFRVLESAGSRAILTRVIEPLLRSERETARQQERKDTDISRQNYLFTYAGTDQGNGAYIFMVEPRTANKYLLRGKIWIDKQSLGIVRIEGEPAISPSFWVRKTRFVHQYGHFGDFWFPVSNRTEVELRVFGKSTLSIDYYGYEWQPALMARIK